MRLRLSVFFILVFGFFLASSGLDQQSAEELYQSGLYKEEVNGDLQGAIDLYKQIIANHGSNHAIAAKAQLRIGICFEKLGKSEAIKAYELVLKNYSGQTEQVAAARARLAALRAEKPGGLTVTKIESPEGHFDVQALSPDGTKMAVVVFDEGQNIAVYDLVTKRIESVTHLDISNVTYNAIWSPDGKEIAYLQDGHPTSISLKDLNLLMVSTLDGKTRPIFSTEEGIPRPIDWLPDGSAVVASLAVSPQEELEGINLGLVPAAGGAFKALHPLEGGFNSGELAAFADASPDGRHIVFADGPKRDAQNIYCIGTDGQSLEILTDHAANDIQPRWSPDGKYVVFLSFRSGSKALWGVSVKNGKSAGEPFIIQEMGQGTNLLNWTTRGLAYSNWIDMWDVYMVPVDPKTGEPTGRLEQLDYSPPGGNRGAVWSPDGKHIAFFSADRGGQPGQGNIVIMPTQGGQAHEYLIPMDAFYLPNMMDLRWMPDSSGLGFSGSGKKGPTLFRLTLASEKWETWQIPVPLTRIEWGSNGNTYFYTKNGIKGGILEHNLETGEEQYIHRPGKNLANAFNGLRFSRDYKKMVFHRIDVKIKNNKITELVGKNIVVVDMSTGQARTIDSEELSNLSWNAAWSSDGQNLVVINNVEDKPSEMFIVPSQGGMPNKVELTGGPTKARRIITDWSPDGRHIAFEIRQSTSEIFVMKNIIPKKQR
ncbi:MAG: PD40 domain-containing protein [Candidatus Aminicenantes bacterium]|nr:MAG: PD40 domain-containing protein [Candidatus Aminicenantes bacterium]